MLDNAPTTSYVYRPLRPLLRSGDARNGKPVRDANQMTPRASTIVDNLGLWPNLPTSFKERWICWFLRRCLSNPSTVGRSRSASSRFRKKLCRSSRARFTPRSTGWSSKVGSNRSGGQPRPGGWPSSIRSLALDGGNYRRSWQAGHAFRLQSTSWFRRFEPCARSTKPVCCCGR